MPGTRPGLTENVCCARYNSCALPFSAPGRPDFISAICSSAGGRTPTLRSSSRTRPTPPSASAWCSPTARSSSCARTIPETFAAITPQMESWDDMTLVHRNERVVIDGIGFAAIGRLKLLQLLQQRAALGRRRAGIFPRGDLARRIRRRRSGGRRRRRQFAGAAHLRGRIRRQRHVSRQSLRLVRHRPALRHADADLPPHADRRFQRASLPLRAGAQHVHRRNGRGEFRARRLRAHGRIGIAQPVPENLRRRARRPSADFQQFDLAAVSVRCATRAGTTANTC